MIGKNWKRKEIVEKEGGTRNAKQVPVNLLKSLDPKKEEGPST